MSYRDLFDRRALLGLLIIAMMIVTGVGYYQQAADMRRITDCQSRQDEALAEAIAARAQANSDVDDAQRVFLRVRADPNATPQQRQDSIHTYLDALDRIDSTRSENPLIAGGCR